MGMMNAKNYAKHKLGDKVKIRTTTGAEGAKQEFREECDINYIVKRFSTTGHLPVNMQSIQPVFADVSTIGDFGSALRRIQMAQEAFAELPADLRLRFGNEPENLVAFLQDNKNREEAISLGLIAKPEPAALPAALPAPAPAPAPTPKA